MHIKVLSRKNPDHVRSFSFIQVQLPTNMNVLEYNANFDL